MDPPPPAHNHCLTIGETEYYIMIPANNAHPPDGTTFMVDLVCGRLHEFERYGPQRATELTMRNDPHDLAKSSDYQWFKAGSRFWQYLYVFLLPDSPHDLSLRFRIPMIRLRFFAANEDRLPLSH